MNNTNYSRAVMLFNEDIRAIKVSYDKDIHGNPVDIKYFKTMNSDLQVGDLVVIPTDTRHKATICRVEEVDCEIDFQSGLPLEWIIDVVNRSISDKIIEQEKEWIDQMKKAEKRAERERIKANMIAMYKDEGVDVEGLAQFSTTNAIEHKKGEK